MGPARRCGRARAFLTATGRGVFITRMPKAPCGFLTWEGSRGKWRAALASAFWRSLPRARRPPSRPPNSSGAPPKIPAPGSPASFPSPPSACWGGAFPGPVGLPQLVWLRKRGTGAPRPRGGLSFGPDALRFGPGRAVPVPRRGVPFGGVRHPGGRNCGLCARKGRAAGPLRQRCPVAGGERLLVSANPVLSGTAHPIARAHTGANAYTRSF